MACNFCRKEWRLYPLFAHGVITKDEFELGVIPDRELVLNDIQMGIDDVDAVWSAYTGISGDSYLDAEAVKWLIPVLPRYDNLWRKLAIWCAEQVLDQVTCPVALECIEFAKTMDVGNDVEAERKLLQEKVDMAHCHSGDHTSADEAARCTIKKLAHEAVSSSSHHSRIVYSEAFNDIEKTKQAQIRQEAKFRDVFNTGIV